ncbi:unnamed protein product [Leptosia nina]|uniref:CUB domain-containing protein n=1 Tax=Leptosia nina TaxID=320188 RepID=A0AAV1J852_9NEOP
MCGAVAALALGIALWTRGAAGGCGVAELACRSGGGNTCVRPDAYCDGEAQCLDGSDEPPQCTPCNRTYYGRVGVAYAVALRGVPRAPFLCHLTFTAGGGAHGDLVQLAFDEFRVGRYEAGALDGCPDGYMQVAELGRPFTGGSWCGVADGVALYYSETATVTVSLRLARLRLGEPFALRLRYKVLAARTAIVRLGARERPLERGAAAPGSYCTRSFEECHRKPCRLQSPNFPGMYPRNVSCYWTLRQKDIPTCKHAMISVRQDHAHKMQIKRSISMARNDFHWKQELKVFIDMLSLNKTGRAVLAWRACTGERDRLIFYDGASTDDPVLLEYCGGDLLPRVASRGPDMLVAFHSSPFSAPPRAAAPLAPLQGFELDVHVIFADSDSLDYARYELVSLPVPQTLGQLISSFQSNREARRCEFHVKASSSDEELNVTAPGISTRGRRGRIHAPTHTLPPNTTCTWTFHGRPGDLVWIYFSSFTQYSLVDNRRVESGEEDKVAEVRGRLIAGSPCAVELRIWEGGETGGNGALLGRYCDSPPSLCARAALANATRVPRPCSPPDGYVSTASLLSIAATTLPGTATHPLAFSLHYEFVDARLEGTPLPISETRVRSEPPECARRITVPGSFTSPRNAMWFGRGGAKRLRCVTRVQADGARVELSLLSAAFGRDPRCVTRLDSLTGRPSCVNEHLDLDLRPTDTPPDFDDWDDEIPSYVPHLRIYESPWPGYRIPVACICDNSSAPMSIVSGGPALELELVASALAPGEDHRHIHYVADWRRRTGPSDCAQRRRLPPPGGHVHLIYPYNANRMSECGDAPFLLVARGNRSVFLRVWGEEIPLLNGNNNDINNCRTSNRILVYDTYSSRLVKAICPGTADSGAVHIYSDGWDTRTAAREASLLVRWAARESGAAHFAWMEVWRAAPAANNVSACARACIALAACMPPALWCDGAPDCPGGADEAGACGAGARLLAALGAPAAAGAAGAAAAAAALALLAVLAVRRRRARRDKQLLGAIATRSRRLTDELLYDGERSSLGS